MIQRLKDFWLEVRIRWTLHNFMTAEGRAEQLAWAYELRELHGKRSPKQVARMTQPVESA